jgi:TRAP-type C4-dicarboxylate transport system permease small subunit
MATLAGVHAVVHLLIDRLPLHARVWPVRTTQLISALYFIVLVAGGLWLTADMWSGHEQSELLGIPFRPLRIFANASLAGAAGVFLFRALRRDRE